MLYCFVDRSDHSVVLSTRIKWKAKKKFKQRLDQAGCGWVTFSVILKKESDERSSSARVVAWAS